MQLSTIRQIIFTSLCAVVLPVCVVAYDSLSNNAYSSDGHSYQMTCNDNGFVLTSVYPTARFIDKGVASEVIEGFETIYLGKSCDAYHEVFGNGTWGIANGGFVASFDNNRVGFPRQGPFCEDDVDPALAFDFNCPL